MTDGKKDLEAMSFEQALDELETIIESLEKGNVPLDQSIAHYERGDALRKHCKKLLNAAEDKVEKIRLDREGNATGTEPLDPL